METRFAARWRALAGAEEGQGLVEYALIISLVVITLVGVVSLLAPAVATLLGPAIAAL